MVSDTRFSRTSLFEFIDYVDKKGLVKHSAARNWRSATKQLLSILNNDEAADLRSIDVDELISRFANIKGTKMTQATMRVYRTRFATAITNFISWAEDPVNFKPNVNSRVISKAVAKTQKPKKTDETWRPQLADHLTTSTTPTKSAPDSVIFPIPLADGRIVTVHNLPNNLLSKDAEKICAVIRALATDHKS